MKPKIARRFLSRNRWKLTVVRMSGSGPKSLLRMEAKARKVLQDKH